MIWCYTKKGISQSNPQRKIYIYENYERIELLFTVTIDEII